MHLRTLSLLTALVSAAGCNGTTANIAASNDGGGDGGNDGGSDAGDVLSNLRGTRYCEVLVATLDNQNLHVDVYNTQGLSDCPDAEWNALDTNQIKTEFGATMVILNGPRYWMLDAIVVGELLDTTVKTFGNIPMRKAGAIDLTLTEAQMMQTPYTLRHIQRTTVFRFQSGKSVYELLDPDGHVYEMQSYSVQKTAQTQDDLKTLDARLTLPTGWTFRTRVLASDLLVTAVNHLATVVQDDFANTYQQSQ